jgi:hypothetical protein
MEPTLFVCTNRRLGSAGSCAGSGSVALMDLLRVELAARGLGWHVASTVCLGQCPNGPNIKAAPGGPLLHHCPSEGVAGLVDALLAAGWPTR